MNEYYFLSIIGVVLTLMVCFIKPYREFFERLDFTNLCNDSPLPLTNYSSVQILILHAWLCIPFLNILLIEFLLFNIVVYVVNWLFEVFGEVGNNTFKQQVKDKEEFRKIVQTVAISFIILPIEIMIVMVDNFITNLINRK